jgi:outer membrane protein assembly factor BamB
MREPLLFLVLASALAGMKRYFIFGVLAFGFTGVTAKEEAEWTRFRGPNGTGHGLAKGLPVQWTNKDYSWKVKLPGVGHSSPVLWGDRLFTTCADEGDGAQYVLCYDALNGEKIWEKKLQSVKYLHHKFNSFASATPCVDADNLYVNWTTKASNDLLCFDHDGKLRWRRDFGGYETQHGNGFSPIVHGELVVLTHDHYGKSSVVAVDRKTGKTKWQTDRSSAKPSSSTPCIYQPKDGPLQFVTSSMAHGCYGVEAKTGKILWETGPGTLDLRSVASPYPANGRFFASCGSGGRASRFAAVIPPKGGLGKAVVAYSLKKNIPYVPTSIAKGNLLFFITDGGIGSCLDLATGEMKWRERLGGNYFASPILVGDVIYAVSREGEVFAIAPTDKYQVLGKSLLGELTYNTPAVANGSIYFRTYSQLFRLPGKKN